MIAHTVICGDCEKELSKLADKSIDLVIMDPPYSFSHTKADGISALNRDIDKYLKDIDDIECDKGYDIRQICEKLLPKMKEVNVYIWCNKKQITEYLDFFVKEHKCLYDILIWNKTNAMPTFSNKYLTDCEYCLYFHKGKGKTHPQSYEDAKTVYASPLNVKDKKLYGHPTIKPCNFTQKLIRNSSREGDLVLDAFSGSGTTAVACAKEHRRSISIEVKPEYCDIVIKRLATEGGCDECQYVIGNKVNE